MEKQLIENPVVAYFKKSEVSMIDGYAKKLGMTRSDFTRKMVLMGLQDFKLLKSVGAIAAGHFMREMLREGIDQGLLKAVVS